MPGTGASQSARESVSAGTAAGAHLRESVATGPRFPGEDGGESLAKMAESDLDAALQLLAERAQYITGASGAAIALRRNEHSDMLCRASAGSNAPELGALLSTEFGLSGESVRTGQPLHCDDTERDPRVNREGCRQLGIASVVVMPIVSEQQVLGVFELFSGEPHAFEERDLSALQRLGEMVETAVRHAMAAQSMPVVQEPAGADGPASEDVVAAGALPAAAPEAATLLLQAEKTGLEKTELEQAEPELAPKNPLFWSAAERIPAGAEPADDADNAITVPFELRSFEKCNACGFPVSRGRTLCVECEEKKWRGQRVPQPAVSADLKLHPEEAATDDVARAAPVADLPKSVSQDVVAQSVVLREVAEDVATSEDSTLLLSAAAPSESWFAANKYVLGALLVVAVVVGLIVWLR
jgi:hypothetical protein